jgi:hypothetical protein
MPTDAAARVAAIEGWIEALDLYPRRAGAVPAGRQHAALT